MQCVWSVVARFAAARRSNVGETLRPIRIRRCAATATAVCFWCCMSGMGYGQVSVLTYHNDVARTGQNLNETILTPANVNQNQFGKLVSYNVDGFVVAQPLYLQNVSIPNSGSHNVVYVATLHDSVYAFDADNTAANGTPLWQISFLNPAMGITSVSGADAGCTGVSHFTEHGIIGTPVIDPYSGTLYVIAKTNENGTYFQRLHALDVATGQEKFGGPVVISASVPGTGDGSSTVTFTALNQMSRPGLLLLNNTIYILFADNGCKQVHNHGWALAYDAQTLQQTGVFNTTPNDNNGGSWQAGSGAAADSSGNIYFETADGLFDADTGGADFGDSILKLTPDDNGLSLADYFTPMGQLLDNLDDLDLGSVGPLVLPDQPGPYPHLLIGSGKDETIYLVNRDNMGGYSATQDQIVQEVPAVFTGHRDGVATYWNGMVYFQQFSSPVIAYSLSNGLLSTTPVTQTEVGYSRNYPSSISANGTTNGILWLVTGDSGTNFTLRAFDPTDLTTEFYDSDQAGTRDSLSTTAHWTTPTIANGKVYVGTQTQLVIYGLQGGDPLATPNPTSLSFSSQNVGTTSAPQTITLTNNGSATLAVSSVIINGANAGDFGQTNNCTMNIAPGTYCTINVTFSPTAANGRSAAVAITDNANNSPQSVSLTGTGVTSQTTTVSLSASVNPSVFDQTVGFTATITPQFGGQATGTVTFMDGITTLGNAGVSGNAATLNTSALAVGNHTITASYSGDSNFTGSTSPGFSQLVNQATVTTTLTVAPNPSTVGQSVQLTATISGQFGGTPSGTVKFLAGTSLLGKVAISNGQAALNFAFTGSGVRSLTANYSGDANFLTGTSPPWQQTIQKVATSTVLTSSQNPSSFNQLVTFTATVSFGSGNPPDGEMVTFKDGKVKLGTGILSGGAATYATSSLKSGTHNITSTYAGDVGLASSTSPVLPQTVNQATSATVLTAAPNPSNVGQSVQLTATVSGLFGGTPSGTVKFMAGTNLLGRVAISNGQAVLNFAFTGSGVRSLTANYSGDANFLTSASPPWQQTIQKAPTSSVLTSSQNPSRVSQLVTFTATVGFGGGNPPDGEMVTFKDGKVKLGTGILSGGAATYATSSLKSGTHNITSTYGGDGATRPELFSGASANGAVRQAQIERMTATASSLIVPAYDGFQRRGRPEHRSR